MMTDILFVKNFSEKLTITEKEDFLRHFGAQKVWLANKNIDTIFAQFPSVQAAQNALYRLHQVEILGKRLRVEYLKNKGSLPNNEDLCKNEDKFQKFVDVLNNWNSSLNFQQPPPPHLSYKYPPPTPPILFNIMDALLTNNRFYIQTLHLMNKMCLNPPFGEISGKIKTYLLESLNNLNIELPASKTGTENVNCLNLNKNEMSFEESEISSDENEPATFNDVPSLPIKRQRVKKPIKRILPLKIYTNNPSNCKKSKLKTEDVFENNLLQDAAKKINFKVDNLQLPSVEHVEKLNTQTINRTEPKIECLKDNSDSCEPITLKNILENKISVEDMKILAVFKNYQPGEPSTKLYIKNLAKDVCVTDLEKIYKRYLADCDYNGKELFDIRLMQEGRMKGQAFVNLPSVELCKKALNETNGFILKTKPMVVQFAKTSK